MRSTENAGLQTGEKAYEKGRGKAIVFGVGLAAPAIDVAPRVEIVGLTYCEKKVMSPTEAPKRLVIVAATGMVGGYALLCALDHPAVGIATAIGR